MDSPRAADRSRSSTALSLCSKDFYSVCVDLVHNYNLCGACVCCNYDSGRKSQVAFVKRKFISVRKSGMCGGAFFFGNHRSRTVAVEVAVPIDFDAIEKMRPNYFHCVRGKMLRVPTERSWHLPHHSQPTNKIQSNAIIKVSEFPFFSRAEKMHFGCVHECRLRRTVAASLLIPIR